MFNDVFGLAGQCAENFHGGVRDNFGASFFTDVLDPIIKDIMWLRSFNEEFQKLSMDVDQRLQGARSLQPKGSSKC
jgi:hypothetical protein